MANSYLSKPKETILNVPWPLSHPVLNFLGDPHPPARSHCVVITYGSCRLKFVSSWGTRAVCSFFHYGHMTYYQAWHRISHGECLSTGLVSFTPLHSPGSLPPALILSELWGCLSFPVLSFLSTQGCFSRSSWSQKSHAWWEWICPSEHSTQWYLLDLNNEQPLMWISFL